MKKLPIYGLFIGGYAFIFTGIIKLYNDLEVIQTVEITQPQTTIKIWPLLLLSTFTLLIVLSISGYALGAFWKHFKAHKTLIPLPIIGVAIAFVWFANSIMKSVSTMIMNNAELFTSNLATYTTAFNSLIIYTVIGIVLIIGSVIYSVYLQMTSA